VTSDVLSLFSECSQMLRNVAVSRSSSSPELQMNRVLVLPAGHRAFQVPALLDPSVVPTR
jgi:hypothetical protein